MVLTDPIADMLTRVRNGNLNRAKTVDIPASRVKEEILDVIVREGYIASVERVSATADVKYDVLRVTLKYTDKKERVIKGIQRISKPGLRVYSSAEDMPRVLNGLGIAVISTSMGIMTDKEARKQKLGGEVLAYIW